MIPDDAICQWTLTGMARRWPADVRPMARHNIGYLHWCNSSTHTADDFYLEADSRHLPRCRRGRFRGARHLRGTVRRAAQRGAVLSGLGSVSLESGDDDRRVRRPAAGPALRRRRAGSKTPGDHPAGPHRQGSREHGQHRPGPPAFGIRSPGCFAGRPRAMGPDDRVSRPPRASRAKETGRTSAPRGGGPARPEGRDRQSDGQR